MQIKRFRSRLGFAISGALAMLGGPTSVGAEPPTPTAAKTTPPVGPSVQLGASQVALLLTASEEREVAVKQPREVFKRAADESVLRVKRRADFVTSNPEAKEAEKALKPLKLSPTGFSWVDQGAVTPIKNQNPYGTCWAFSLTSVMETAWFLRHYEQVDLAEQDLINCSCRKCGSSDPPRHLEKLAAGVRPNEANPYKGDGAKPACKVSNCGACATSESTAYRAEIVVPVDPENIDDGAKAYEPVTVDKIKQALRDHGSIHAKMHIPTGSSFGSFSGDGVFNETIPLVYDNPATAGDERNNGAHLVNIVGWDDVKQAWLIKNSWGTGWGKNGFGWLKWGSNKIGMSATWLRAVAPEFPFTAVWTKESADEVEAYGWEYKDFRARYDAIWGQGYRLHTLRIKMDGGKPLYSAVWRKGAVVETQVYGQSLADFKRKYDELWKDGWRLHLLENYVEGGAVKYTAIWRQGAMPETPLYGQTFADYKTKSDELSKDGWRLHILETFLEGSVVKYTAVWRKDPAQEVQLYDQSYTEYRKKYDELWKDGWRLHILSNHVFGGRVRYTAVWRKTNRPEVQVYGWDYDAFRARDAELRKDGWRLAIVNPL